MKGGNIMVECIISWIMLIAYLITQRPECIIASGLFAIAAQIYMLRSTRITFRM